ncbi:LPXTG cell wall anchor domain-containing protein [Halobacillus sp. Marseille-Q1614]|uniref:LPXTG cell wall anchor domain-containing protein n=1 Tax=Halobacillus sp. Marseille-Q1614 TaxID=2709134 RepID=UPI0020C31A3D|nr:LPXTG cell wall anchor domain-containing protein [Halobacillus sp. Marseille-Q1614]
MKKLLMAFCSVAFLAGIFLGSGPALASHGDVDRNCDDFDNKQEVMEFWDSHGYDENNDPSDLDRDNDNLPCETTQGDWDEYNASKDSSGDSSSDESKDNEEAAGSSDDGDGTSADEGGELPNTATSNPLMMLVGALLLGTGGLLFIRKNKLS